MPGESLTIEHLIAPLIGGLVEYPPWRAFLDVLRAEVAGDYASLVFRPLPLGTPEARVIHLYSGAPSPAPVSRLYREDLYLRDPMPYHEMVEGRTYRLDQLLHFGEPAHDAYLTQLLVPSGMNHMRMIRFAAREGTSGWITVTRRNGEFDAEVDRLLEAMAPYMRAALGSFVALERERMTATVTQEAVRRMSFGWLTLDGEGRVLDADAHGSRMLDAGNRIARGRDGKLTAHDTALRRQLLAAVRELAVDPQAPPQAIVLAREPWLDLLMLPSGQRTGTTQAAPAIVCYLHADNWSSTDCCNQLAQLFDLTPSEARLALALSRGMSIAEAAGQVGLTVESARTYSKRIYAKTGARSHADLVRFIHRSVLVIA
ncbi:helix-turn-helix transcriptional regulator [Novosphingobium sp. fls2-241-R2A-195]|jgi:DNA-binding CsgD family transcriptional regulator|uniref:helix-turn-helix transcriptional regulator n=1 Tax=Novosphingobium sp. fls2-241-R2A-195 TaxID=3040296 RepID=UPI00254DD483|nr:helix-turn-helix transcriptional regulator [Novosphingobium sp. fls2-241-R2A-195]